MKRGWQVAAVLSTIVVAGLTYNWVTHSSDGGLDSFQPTELVAKRTRFVKSAVARGLVKPKVGAEVKVGSQVSGIVKRMYVGVGEYVSRGQILAELDSTRKAAEINAIRQRLNAARADWEYSRKGLQRMVAINEASRSLISAQAIDEKRQQVEVNEAAYKRTLSELEEQLINLSYSRITAPIDGTIVDISTYEGETVAASFAAPTFVSIIDLKRQEVQTYVDEADIGSVHVGQQVDFRLESYPGRMLHGVVRAINPKPEVVNNVVNYVVLVDFEQPADMVVRPEMTAQVDFVLEVRENAVIVSSRALMREDGADFVAVKQAGRWTKQPVKTGLRDSGEIEILSGLKVGDVYMADKNEWNKIAAQR